MAAISSSSRAHLEHSSRFVEVHFDVELQHQLAALFQVQRTRTVLVSLVELHFQPTEKKSHKIQLVSIFKSNS